MNKYTLHIKFSFLLNFLKSLWEQESRKSKVYWKQPNFKAEVTSHSKHSPALVCPTVTIFIAMKLEKVTRQLTLNRRVSTAVVIRSLKILPFACASQSTKKSHEELSGQGDLLGLLFCSWYFSSDSAGIAAPGSRVSDLICKAFTTVSRKPNTLLPAHSGAGVTFPLT